MAEPAPSEVTTRQKRQLAHRLTILQLTGKQLIRQEGFNPSYIELGQTKVTRINIIATAVSKYITEDKNYASLTIDDSTDTIRVKAFGVDVPKIEKINSGDLVKVIGKLKQYNEELYISPEIIRPLDKNWMLLRKLELLDQFRQAAGSQNLRKPQTTEQPGDEQPQQIQEVPEINPTAELLKAIKALDKGDGADWQDITKQIKLDEDELKKVLISLLKEGEVFEPRKNKYKVLD